MQQGLTEPDLFLYFQVGRNENEFTVFYGAIARWVYDRVPETIKQLHRLSKMKPCGVLIPETDIPARELVASGPFWPPLEEIPAIREAMQELEKLGVE